MTRFDQLLEKSKVFYDNGDPGHDFAHIQRVVENCRRIGATVRANLEILLPAAVLHDIVNLPKNHPERLEASRLAAERSKEVLSQCEYSPQEIEQIGAVIVEHSYSLGKKPTSTESAVLQDADKLDALGAIGVMRTVSCGVRMGASYYHPQEFHAETRELNDKSFTIDHFFTKLLKLPQLMNTEAAKQEAQARAEYMRVFLKQLQSEVEMKNI